MIIKSVHIYGFGKWQDYRLELPNNKLIVIYGENETGKSTLRQFLLFLLFGFPPKKREFFRPKTGGRIGGRMEVWTEKEGTFIIERIHEKNNGEAVCYLEDGKEKGESWLKERLHRMDEKMFAAIFSFSANDLNYLHQVREEEIGEVLLGMGMAGTNTIHEAEKKLDQELEQRFKPQGKNPPINQQITMLETMEKKLEEVEKQEEPYQFKKQKEKDLVAELEHLQSETEQLLQQEREVEKKIQASPLLADYRFTQDELPSIQEIDPFPENGLERYSKLRDAILPIESELSVLKANKNEYMEKQKEIEKNLLDNSLRNEWFEFEKEAEPYKRKVDQLDYHIREFKNFQKKLEDELDVLNIGIRFEELEELTLPFYTEDKWNELRQEKQLIESELLSTKEKESEVEKEKAHLEEKKTETEKALRQENTSMASEEVDETASGEKKVHQNEQMKKKDLFSSWVPGIGTVLSVGLFFFSYSRESSWLAIIAVLLLAFSAGQWIWAKQSAKWKTQLTAIQEQNGTEKEFNQSKAQLDYINEQLSRYNRESLQLQEKEKFIQEQQNRLYRKIEEERDSYPFLYGLEIEQWPKLYGLLQQVLFKYKQLHSIQQESGQIEKDLHVMETKAINLLEKKRDFAGGSEFTNPVDELMEEIEKQKMLVKEQERCKEEVKKTEYSIAVFQQKLVPYQADLSHLLKAAEVESEEAFYRKGKRKQLYEEKNKHLFSLFQQLKTLLSVNIINAMIEEDIPNHQELETVLKDKEVKRNFISSRIEDARQQLADTRSLIETMENSDRLSELRHRFELERTRLRESAKEWARYKIAREKLEETKGKYRQQYFPAVMKKTSEIFRFITGGHYTKVLLPEEGNGLLTESKQGMRFQVKELSKGTHDQLYVALKLALSETTSQTSPLPFFIDDAFVHFDESRLHSIPEVLEQTTSSRQVIWFTCNRMMERDKEKYGYIDLTKEKNNSIPI